ncbi:MAG: J domain-containing protein [Betaproteobacteria bacterium]|nr:J domain-containing protein [Betaproteobacteria bacterium]
MTDHYATLGVARTASHEDIRRAYRERMRAAHPDSSGGRLAGASRPAGSASQNSVSTGSASPNSAAAQVSRIAEAWNVLSSPARRAAYDLQLATGSAAGVRSNGAGNGATSGTRAPGTAEFGAQPDRVYPPARFPWRFVLITIGVGTAIILLLHLAGDRTPPRKIDGLISAGSCVDFDSVGAAYEVPCDGPHQGVARELVPFDAACDSDTTQARDRQGMGTVCIEP